MNTLTLFSPAKLNLFLRVINKREDGYHELASLFQAIDLGDTISYQLTEGADSLISTDPTIPKDHTNLIFKAAALFRQKTGLNFGLKVGLLKRIPTHAGLGGGSSNAATTLWALNQLFQSQWTVEELAEWSKELGSDVTFFLSEGTAFCTGRGEVVFPLGITRQNEKPLWILKPAAGLSTPLVFRHFNLQSCSLKQPLDLLDAFFSDKPQFLNDLESAAFSLLPSLFELKQRLIGAGYENVTMTGSGTCIFCFGEQSPKELFDGEIFQVNYLRRSTLNWYQ